MKYVKFCINWYDNLSRSVNESETALIVFLPTFEPVNAKTCDSKTYHTNILRAPKDGWMKYGFKSLSTVFKSYQDDGRVLMKGCVQCWEESRLQGDSNLRPRGPKSGALTAWPRGRFTQKDRK